MAIRFILKDNELNETTYDTNSHDDIVKMVAYAIANDYKIVGINEKSFEYNERVLMPYSSSAQKYLKEFFDYMLQYNINTITNNTTLKDFANLNNYNYWSLYMLLRRVLGNSGDYKSKLNELFAKYKNN